MNKKEFSDLVAEKLGTTKKNGELAVNAVLEVIQETLEKGESVQVVGFGAWSVKNRASRVGRNPATGEEIKIPEKKVPVFKAGKALKDAVANS